MVGAATGPAYAPRFEVPTDDGFDVFLHRSRAVGQQGTRLGADLGSESIQDGDGLRVAGDIHQQLLLSCFAPETNLRSDSKIPGPPNSQEEGGGSVIMSHNGALSRGR